MGGSETSLVKYPQYVYILQKWKLKQAIGNFPSQNILIYLLFIIVYEILKLFKKIFIRSHSVFRSYIWD